MHIKNAQLSAACQVASRVFDGGLNVTGGIDLLSSVHGLKRSTAGVVVSDYRCLVEGRVFKRTLSAPQARLLMEEIFAARSSGARANAVAALRRHIDYYEGHYKVKVRALRTIADEFAAAVAQPATLSELEKEHSRAVESSLRISKNERLKRLATASRIPTSIVVQATVYLRNPDVVAETLLRAGGKCESCKAEAPFLRVKDGTPYLEVHHKQQLAAGGDDSVENAIALCPNCHRRAHYGVAR